MLLTNREEIVAAYRRFREELDRWVADLSAGFLDEDRFAALRRARMRMGGRG
jgi:hypothetical protein